MIEKKNNIRFNTKQIKQKHGFEKSNGLTRRWTKTKNSCTKTNFYRNINMVSEFKVLFSFFFLWYKISGA